MGLFNAAPGSRGKKGDKGGQVTPVTKEAPKTPTDKGVKLAKVRTCMWIF